MYWTNFLHFYQPPSIDRYTIKEMVKYSYSFISRTLRHDPNIKITANINVSLLEHLDQLRYNELLEEYKFLVKDGRIELVLSAAYHPILSLIPYDEAINQIEKAQKILKKNFPEAKIKGFFFPEAIYDKKVAKYLKKIGIEWIFLDELASGEIGKIDYSKRYFDKNSGLQIIFRNRKYSTNFPPKTIREYVQKNKKLEKFAISATDAEVYGARHFDYNGDFFNSYQSNKIKSTTVEEYRKIIKENEKISIKPKSVSWDISIEEFKKKQSLHIWKNPKNKIHKELWKLTNFALKIVEKNKNDENYKWARWRLNRGFSSCTYWFASEKDLGSWDGIQWDPDRVTAGSLNLIRSIRSLKSIPKKQKLKAEKIYLQIVKLTWENHWKKYY